MLDAGSLMLETGSLMLETRCEKIDVINHKITYNHFSPLSSGEGVGGEVKNKPLLPASPLERGQGVRQKINFFVNLQLLPLWSERGGEEVNKNNE